MSESTEFYQRMRQLYPAVSDVDLLPRSWHKDKSVQHLSLSHNNLRVHYKGSGKTGKEAAAVRTHLPIPAACGVYYYEVKVVSKGREGKLRHHTINRDPRTIKLRTGLYEKFWCTIFTKADDRKAIGAVYGCFATNTWSVNLTYTIVFS